MLSQAENTLKLSLPLRASEVIYDSEVHFVSEVSPDGEIMGKLNFTRAKVRTSPQSNFTFAKAKTSQIEKRADIQDFSSCVFALSVCNMGWGLTHWRLTGQM